MAQPGAGAAGSGPGAGLGGRRGGDGRGARRRRHPGGPTLPEAPGADRRPMPTTTPQSVPLVRPERDRFLADENPFEAMMSRFDFAAQKLNLDPGLYQVLRAPEKQ